MTDPHRDQPIVERGERLDRASGAVILIHGRGASALDILDLMDWIDHPEFAYLAPEAAGNSWYPKSFLSPLEQNEPWLGSALAMVGRAVDRGMSFGIAPERIALIGFSQGACLASEFVARSGIKLGGLAALTGGLIGPPGTKFAYASKLDGMPAFLGAGDPDPRVPWKRVEETAGVFTSLGAAVIEKRYPGMGHVINQDEIDHVKEILGGLSA